MTDPPCSSGTWVPGQGGERSAGLPGPNRRKGRGKGPESVDMLPPGGDVFFSVTLQWD